MNQFPLISIILPVFNGENFLQKSIESCLNQTYQNLELIIVNDASTDNSLRIALNFAKKDERVCIHSNASNQKLPASLNIGHRMAQGKLMTWTSHDNFFNPSAIEKMVKAIEETEADVVYSDYSIVEENDSYRRKVILSAYSNILLENIIGASFLYKKEVFLRNNGYNEKLDTVEDYDFWLRCLVHSRFHHIPENLYYYRSHKNSLSSLIETIETEENKNFRAKLKSSYTNFFKKSPLSEEHYPELFTALHRYEKINVYKFLKDYKDFQQDISILEKRLPSFDPSSFFRNVDLRLRMNMQRHQENQNLKTLKQICFVRPMLLTDYDRPRSLRYIRSCFSK